MQRIDTVIIGAGVIGISIARRIARSGREVIVIERERQFGAGTSSRNSEVIHAGIYYPQGSLKARLCVAGRGQLYDFCADRSVPHRRCGKLIVANGADQEAQLERLAESAVANGVEDLQWLGSAQVATLEPEISCTAALMSPSTGIVDSHALMTALLGEAEADGTVVAYKTAVERIDALTNGFAITLEGEGGAALVATRLINAAGLHAIQLAGKITGLPPEHVPKPYWAKGSYFALSGAAPFRRLIYPIPEPGGLGVHATIDLAGRVRFGPDVEWCETLEYGVEEARAESFYAKIRRYWPSLPDGALAPDYSGIRPKLSGPGEPAADFVISGPADHGLAGLVNLFGIESPGLTSALAIADEVEKRLAS